MRATGDTPFPSALLTAGVHVSVTDSVGTRARLDLLMAGRSFLVSPPEAGPRDLVTLTGYGFPADNPDTDSPSVSLLYQCGENCAASVTADPDLTGYFSEVLRAPSNAPIPDTSVVTARIGDTTTVETITHWVPTAQISVTPINALTPMIHPWPETSGASFVPRAGPAISGPLSWAAPTPRPRREGLLWPFPPGRAWRDSSAR